MEMLMIIIKYLGNKQKRQFYKKKMNAISMIVVTFTIIIFILLYLSDQYIKRQEKTFLEFNTIHDKILKTIEAEQDILEVDMMEITSTIEYFKIKNLGYPIHFDFNTKKYIIQLNKKSK